MNLHTKMDLKVFRVGLRWSRNALFSLPIKVLFPKFTINIMGKRRGNKHTYMLHLGRMNHSYKKENLLIFFQLDNNVGAKIYFTSEVFGSSLG
jgi:hypothetical protein